LLLVSFHRDELKASDELVTVSTE